jgi:hypothetical protein
MTPLDDVVKVVSGNTADWIVACTIATEVPPSPLQSSGSQEMFTSAMILAAQQAVAEVIWNRTMSGGFSKTAVGVVLQPKQFSGTLRGLPAPKGGRDIWADALAGSWFPAHVNECYAAWRRVIEMNRTGHDLRLVPGALYYYSPVSMDPPFREPTWAAGLKFVPCEIISADYFRFYRK